MAFGRWLAWYGSYSSHQERGYRSAIQPFRHWYQGFHIKELRRAAFIQLLLGLYYAQYSHGFSQSKWVNLSSSLESHTLIEHTIAVGESIY